jgi:chromosome partitioning protein
LGKLIDEIGLTIAPVLLSHRAVFYHSTGAGKVASEIDPDGKAAAEVAASWDWVGRQVGVPTRRLVGIAARAT